MAAFIPRVLANNNLSKQHFPYEIHLQSFQKQKTEVLAVVCSTRGAYNSHQ